MQNLVVLMLCSYVMAGLFDMICVGLRQLKEAEDYLTYSTLTTCNHASKDLTDFGAHPVFLHLSSASHS